MSLTDKDVKYVAKLAAIELKDEEVEIRRAELETIISYVANLAEIDTRGVAPTCHVHGITNVFRDDIIQDSLDLDELKQMAPDFKNNGFRVPRIIEG